MHQTDHQHPSKVDFGGELGAIYAYWDEIRGGRLAPAWQDFDWLRIPIPAISWCTVVDVRHDPLDFVYRFWGTSRTMLQGKDYTGSSIKEIDQKNTADKAFSEYALVVERREPIYVTTSELVTGEKERISYHFLRLPFSDDGENIHQILGVGIYQEAQIKKLMDFYGTQR
ncbi:MAG: PAS domain-containing protein [Proteobacteria bacterium]|nr:PAS domain-containing protein [Pseudomonadota bacterium]